MELKLSTADLVTIATAYLETKGLSVIGSQPDYKQETEYEYFGDPQNENRRKVNAKVFKGLVFNVE